MKTQIKTLLSQKWVSWAITIIVVGAVVFGLVRIIARDWEKITDYPWRINGWWLASSIVLNGLAIAFSSKIMHRVIKAFGAKIRFLKFLYIFWLANIGRYAPGKVLLVVGMLVMLKRQGIDRRITLSSMVIFQGMSVLMGGVVGVALMGPAFLKEILPAIPGWIIVPIPIIGLIISFPKVFERIINCFLRLTGREQIEYKLPLRDWLVVLFAFVVMWIAFAASFAFLVKAVTPLTFSDFPYVGGAFLVAYVIGWVILIIPGGLGVREGAITLLLSAVLPRGVAGIIAVVSRPWTLVTELLLLAIVALVYRVIMRGEAVIIKNDSVSKKVANGSV